MIRIGFDIGGSKIAALALDAERRELARARRDVPRDYAGTHAALVDMVEGFVRSHGPAASIGIALPGMIGADGTPIRAVNLPWLEGQPFGDDLREALRLPVAVANDANCFVLSEAIDGAAEGAAVVFGATLGTGVGGGIVIAVDDSRTAALTDPGARPADLAHAAGARNDFTDQRVPGDESMNARHSSSDQSAAARAGNGSTSTTVVGTAIMVLHYQCSPLD